MKKQLFSLLSIASILSISACILDDEDTKKINESDDVISSEVSLSSIADSLMSSKSDSLVSSSDSSISNDDLSSINSSSSNLSNTDEDPQSSNTNDPSSAVDPISSIDIGSSQLNGSSEVDLQSSSLSSSLGSSENSSSIQIGQSSEQLSSSSTPFTDNLIPNGSFEENLPKLENACVDPNTGELAENGTAWYCPPPNIIITRERELSDGGVFGLEGLEPFVQCNGTPDLFPNAPTLTVTGDAAIGDWYIGMICDDRNSPSSEAFIVPLVQNLKAGVQYQLDVYLRNNGAPYWNGQIEKAGHLFIIGRSENSSCGPPGNSSDQEVLWDSGQITNTTWKKFTTTLTPTKDWSNLYLSLSDKSSCKVNASHMLMDGFRLTEVP